MKHIVSFEVKIPIPGVAYSNMSTSITLEGDEPYEEMKEHAFVCLENQLTKLASEMKEMMNNV